MSEDKWISVEDRLPPDSENVLKVENRNEQGLSDYWHSSGYDPAIGDRNRQLRAALRKRK